MNEDGNFSISSNPNFSSQNNSRMPDFFKQAVDGIVIDNRPPRKSHRKLYIIIAVVGALFALLIFILITLSNQTLTAKRAKELLTVEDALAASDFDDEIALIYSGKQNDDVLLSEEYYNMMTNGYSAYEKIAKALRGVKDVEGEDEDGRDKKIGIVSGNMNQNLPAYKELIEKYKIVYSAKDGNLSKLNSIKDATTRETARTYLAAYREYDDFLNKNYIANGCDRGQDNSKTCRDLSDKLDDYEDKLKMTGDKTKAIFIGETNMREVMDRRISDDLMDVMAYLGELWSNAND